MSNRSWPASPNRTIMTPAKVQPEMNSAGRCRQAWDRARGSRLLWPLLGLGLLLLFNAIVDPAFFEIGARDGHLHGPLITVLRLAVKVMFLALGMTLVIATGGVDLSVGSVAAMVGALVAHLAAEGAWSVPALLICGGGLALAVGLFNGTLVAIAGLQPIVATLILMVLGRGVALNITGGNPISVSDPFLLSLGRGFFLGLPGSLWLVALAFSGTALACRRTAIGLFVEAVGDNETASRFCGVPARAVKLFVYAFSSLCAALAALVTIGDVGRVEPDRLGQLLELDAITAVVVGGTVLTGGRFSLAGSILGAVLIQALTTTLIRQGMPADLAPVPKALVILIVCLLQADKLRAQLAGWTRRKAAA
jgi:simple sugar transport system permease protein